MKHSPFLPEDQWKQKSVDESVRHIIAELQRQNHDKLMKALAALDKSLKPPK